MHPSLSTGNIYKVATPTPCKLGAFTKEFKHFKTKKRKQTPLVSRSHKDLKTKTQIMVPDEPIGQSQKLLRTIDIFLNVKNQNIKSIKNINFEEYELKNEQK